MLQAKCGLGSGKTSLRMALARRVLKGQPCAIPRTVVREMKQKKAADLWWTPQLDEDMHRVGS
eukprot:4600849-Amphidinium_carterae.1